jgi:hypothetical protein
MTSRPLQEKGRPTAWDDAEDGEAIRSFKPLTREEAAALRAQEPPVSPWRVIAVQAAVGVVAALIGWLVTGRTEVGWSLLYGAATVVVPGALMARGMTSKLSSMCRPAQRRQLHVVGDGENRRFGRDAGWRRQSRAATGAGRPCWWAWWCA